MSGKAPPSSPPNISTPRPIDEEKMKKLLGNVDVDVKIEC